MIKKLLDYFAGQYKVNKKKKPPNYLPEKIHKICLDNIPIVSVDVVIFNSNADKVLLFRRNNNPLKGIYYSLGGRVLKNENLINTAIRKLKDEAGINIVSEALCFGGFMEEFYENSVYQGVDTHNINIFFSYISQHEVIFKLDDQHSTYKWFDIESEDIHPHIRAKIDAIIKKENKTAWFKSG